MRRLLIFLVAALSVMLLPGCAAFLPTLGPSRSAIDSAKPQPNAAAIQIVGIDNTVTRQLLAQRELRLFSETLGNKPIASRTAGPGDMLEVSIWAAAPATLFGTVPMGSTGTTTNAARLKPLAETSRLEYERRHAVLSKVRATFMPLPLMRPFRT